jgi:hypothetical protein
VANPTARLRRLHRGACLAAVQAADLARAVAEFAASGAPLSIEQVADLVD